jgi:hypothetical protein
MKILDDITNSLGHHPYLGAGLSIGQLMAGLIMLVVDHGSNIPGWIMDLFQMGAWTGAMLVAAATIFGVIKTHTTFLDKIKWIKKKDK